MEEIDIVKMDDTLRSKAHRMVRMVFQDVYANYYARAAVWIATPPDHIRIHSWKIAVAESNAGTLQVICAGIETFGRALLGYAADRNVSGRSFTEFVEVYLEYRGKGQEIYESFRCGLLHSHYLGFGSTNGFFPTRNGRALNNNHLEYTDLSGSRASPAKDAQHFRLILNIDRFAEDFRRAVETYLDDLENGRTKGGSGGGSIDLVGNLKKSLNDFPEEDDALLERPTRKPGSVQFGDVSVTATQTSYPLPPPPPEDDSDR